VSQLGDLYLKVYEHLRPRMAVYVLGGVGVGMFCLFAIIILPYAKNQRVIYVPEKDPTELTPLKGRPIPPMDIKAALGSTPEALKHGQALFNIQCVACHGSEGKGNGPAGLALNPPPRNFTSAQGWVRGYKIADIYTTLSEGLAGVMPSFDVLSPTDRFALAHYVQSLGKFPHGPQDATAVAYLDGRYHLSKGGREPNQVSVPWMMDHMVKESRPRYQVRVPEASSPDGALLAEAVDDATRVSALLNHLAGWDVHSASLARAAIEGAPDNGFAPIIATWNRAKMEQLHAALLRHSQKGVTP